MIWWGWERTTSSASTGTCSSPYGDGRPAAARAYTAAVAAYGFDLGSFRRATSTRWHDAQKWFDRGLAWSYAFNHEEALDCLEQAIAADETFAMAHWGLAYAIGPSYNKQWDMFDEVDLKASLRRAHDASSRAQELAAGAPAVERALADALRKRYPSPEAPEDFTLWNDS